MSGAVPAASPVGTGRRAKSVRITRLNAGMSFGVRRVTRFPSTTTSASTPSAPAFLRSVRSDGREVIRVPFASPASTTVHGP